MPPGVVAELKERNIRQETTAIRPGLDPQASLDQRAHDVTQTVSHPYSTLVTVASGTAQGLRTQNTAARPARSRHTEAAGRPRSPCCQRSTRSDGTRNVEDPARGKEVGDDLGPAAQVGQPAKHPMGGVDDLESTVKDRRQVVDV